LAIFENNIVDMFSISHSFCVVMFGLPRMHDCTFVKTTPNYLDDLGFWHVRQASEVVEQPVGPIRPIITP